MLLRSAEASGLGTRGQVRKDAPTPSARSAGPKQLSPHRSLPEPSHTFLLEYAGASTDLEGAGGAQPRASAASNDRGTTGGGNKTEAIAEQWAKINDMSAAKAYGNAMEAAGAAMKFAMM